MDRVGVACSQQAFEKGIPIYWEAPLWEVESEKEQRGSLSVGRIVAAWGWGRYWSRVCSEAVQSCWSSSEEMLHVQGQRRPGKMVGGAKSCLEANPIAPEALRGFKPCAHQDPETPQRLSQNCVWVSPVWYRSAVACCRGSGSGCSGPRYGISPLGGGRC